MFDGFRIASKLLKAVGSIMDKGSTFVEDISADVDVVFGVFGKGESK